MHDLFPLYDERLTIFAENYTSVENELLAEVAGYTYKNNPEAHMLSGRQQGTLLKFISVMMRPKRILEIGTFTGYSALCLAEGLADDGILHTIELREETAAIANNFFKKSALSSKIKLHTGNATDVLARLNEEWDLVFIDADKSGYINYFNAVIPWVKKNGFILADNIFFHGRALEDAPTGKSGKAIKEFNEFIHQRNDIEKLALTIRDGLFILRKL